MNSVMWEWLACMRQILQATDKWRMHARTLRPTGNKPECSVPQHNRNAVGIDAPLRLAHHNLRTPLYSLTHSAGSVACDNALTSATNPERSSALRIPHRISGHASAH